ncbi:MAG TPA: bifunctional hydroxymethylpyrimidine kinase/phosphomethylpyrimidine kinase [Candidatus Dormibacteraeota bacterium]|jgi:hydroxymethylpyrimidine/phosphomethylpyrimidine kinase|nr:bifunctional hydroxymethylpyrimidine kinase/phosphomethylpyrimidine kinase [Candidatus Dormibacteraeota bacterium]
MAVPVACSVAGSDPSAGAGIQADLKAFAACGVYGATVVTVVTAQNTTGVAAVHPVPAEMVGAQIDAVASDLAPAAWKTGMLGDAEIVAVVARRLRLHRVTTLVVDPVIRSSSGRELLTAPGVAALVELLLPLATVVTPNLDEAAALTGVEVTDLASAREAARVLCAAGPRVAVVTGGHLPGERVVDVVCDRDAGVCLELAHPRVAGRGGHGTGCTLSAAITAFLARGVAPLDAVASAGAYVVEALRRAPGLGRGEGPLGHLAVEDAAVVSAVVEPG